jgi:hypothetical protein
VAETDPIIAALSSLIDEVGGVTTYDAEIDTLVIRDKAAERRLHTRCLSAIDRFAPPGSVYQKQAEEMRAPPSWVTDLAQMLEALRDDYATGGMRSVAELVHASLFDDLLEMASELQLKGFHAPAAVLAGSVLEEHLRKLAAKHGISVRDARNRPKSVEALGVELVKAQIISEPRRKIIGGWYGQRTEGAHGRVENVVPDEVPRMIEGIRDFVANYPA